MVENSATDSSIDVESAIEPVDSSEEDQIDQEEPVDEQEPIDEDQAPAETNVEYESIIRSVAEEHGLGDAIAGISTMGSDMEVLLQPETIDAEYSFVASQRHNSGEPVDEEVFENHISMFMERMSEAIPEE